MPKLRCWGSRSTRCLGCCVDSARAPYPRAGPPTDNSIILEVFERRLRNSQTEWEVKQEASDRHRVGKGGRARLRGTADGTIENIIEGVIGLGARPTHEPRNSRFS
jgi:hypothetical protein